ALVRDGRRLVDDEPIEARDELQELARVVEMLEAVLRERVDRALPRQLAAARDDLAHARDQHPLQPLRQRERVEAEGLSAPERRVARRLLLPELHAAELGLELVDDVGECALALLTQHRPHGVPRHAAAAAAATAGTIRLRAP